MYSANTFDTYYSLFGQPSLVQSKVLPKDSKARIWKANLPTRQLPHINNSQMNISESITNAYALTLYMHYWENSLQMWPAESLNHAAWMKCPYLCTGPGIDTIIKINLNLIQSDKVERGLVNMDYCYISEKVKGPSHTLWYTLGSVHFFYS